jgi:hypothetical protein
MDDRRLTRDSHIAFVMPTRWSAAGLGISGDGVKGRCWGRGVSNPLIGSFSPFIEKNDARDEDEGEDECRA